MSYTLPSVGDYYQLAWNTLVTVPAAAYSAPAVGDLVYRSLGVANEVNLLSGTNAIWGIVESVNQNNGYLTVARLVPGTTITLPYTGTVNLGDKVLFSSATQGSAVPRTQIKTDNTNGTGKVIAVDSATAYGTGYCVVEF